MINITTSIHKLLAENYRTGYYFTVGELSFADLTISQRSAYRRFDILTEERR